MNRIIVDLGLGDAGKGGMVDYLSNSESVVVRYNGGPQCAHNVITPDGKHHTFAQFGSGTFNGAHTHLSRFMLVNPVNMMNEMAHLRKLGLSPQTTVDPRAQIVTRFHVAANRIREIARRGQRHGSTGQGVGEARADALAGNDVIRVQSIGHGLEHALQDTRVRMSHAVAGWWKKVEGDKIADAEWQILIDPDVSVYADQYRLWVGTVELRHDDWLGECDGRLVFEGAQGVLLDETHGFAPYHTWTNTTADNALTLLHDVGLYGEVIGVTRTYMTRHGAGPLPTEDDIEREEPHNGVGRYQGAFRTGPLDIPLLRYALSVCPVGRLAVTHMDRLDVFDNPVAAGDDEITSTNVWDYKPTYEQWSRQGFAERTAEWLRVPLGYTSHGPTREDKNVLAVV